MRTIVVFSGAGLSQESGIPTFRAADGLWRNHRIEDVATQTAWQRDKRLVLDFYAQRYELIRQAEPNAAHRAIAQLDERFRVVNITQNIDDLLERAGCRRVIHLHGSVRRKKCEWHRDIGVAPSDSAPGGLFTCDYDAPQTATVELGEACPACGGQLRPGIVWFGEAVEIDYELLRDLHTEMADNDGVFVVVGSSLQVYPAAGVATLFAHAPHKYAIDPEPQPTLGFTLLKGTAGARMTELAEQLLGSSQS